MNITKLISNMLIKIPLTVILSVIIIIVLINKRITV